MSSGLMASGSSSNIWGNRTSSAADWEKEGKRDGEVEMEDVETGGMSSMREPSSGPMRSKAGSGEGSGEGNGEGSSKGPIAAPVKSACTFCRSRKSRCNGKQPCAACVNRSQPDDCIYTISRRGGKPKSKQERVEPMESHLEKILELSDLPHLVRVPNAVPQLQGFMDESGEGSSSNPFSIHTSFSHAALSPTLSSSTSRERSKSIQIDNLPATKPLLTDFYRLFFRFVPIMPDSSYLDHLSCSMPSDSPFLLALQCVLPVIRNEPLVSAPASNEGEKKKHIRTQASYFAKRAESAIDSMLESIETRPEEDDYHMLEVIQALCLLIIYEYGSGRALKARLKADTALGIAMSRGLHRLSASGNNGIKSPGMNQAKESHYLSIVGEGEMYEVRKRVWWTLWSMTMWTAYNTGRIPTIRADDPRISSELPHCKDGKAWAYSVSSLQGLLLVQDRVLALSNIEHGRAVEAFNSGTPTSTRSNLPSLPFQSSSSATAVSSSHTNDQGIPRSFSGHPTMSNRADILQSMLEIDGALQEQMEVLKQTTEGIVSAPGKGQGSTDEDTRYLNFVWAMQLYTASLTLHVGQAFQGATLFERKLCFLSSISESNDAAACQVPMPNIFDEDELLSFVSQQPLALATEQDLYARGPFLPKQSLKRCVDASDKLLQISRNMGESKEPFASPNNPFNACSFVLISFVCLMQALAISSNVTDDDTGQSQMGLTPAEAPSLLKSAQGAAALTPSLQPPSSTDGSSSLGRQQQLQLIWARVKEAQATLRKMSRHWDMVIPMAEEVGGCLEASQFLLSQQDLSGGSAAPTDSGPVM